MSCQTPHPVDFFGATPDLRVTPDIPVPDTSAVQAEFPAEEVDPELRPLVDVSVGGAAIGVALPAGNIVGIASSLAEQTDVTGPDADDDLTRRIEEYRSFLRHHYNDGAFMLEFGQSHIMLSRYKRSSSSPLYLSRLDFTMYSY